jgi:hypothetical protein
MHHASSEHGSQEEWGPVTAVANSEHHHDQSIRQGTTHSGPSLHVAWNVERLITLE